jgi:hypothetical protein
MKKFILLLSSLCAIMALAIGLSSCKDDEPFVKPNLSVASATLTIGEAGGTLQVEVVLDKGAPEDITIEYDLGGTAISPADYTIVGQEGEVEIAKDQTSGIIQIQIVSDALYEGDETIEVSLDDVSSDNVVITNNDETVVTITDDDPQLKLSMATATVTANEADGDLLEIEVVLDHAAAQAVTVGYALSGTAVDSLFAYSQNPKIPPQYYDYYIEGVSGELVIAQGATSGKIEVQLLTDFQFEDDETVIITLNDASEGVEITANNKTTITVGQQDGKVIALVWDPSYTNVDMDLFLWIGDDIADLFFVASSANDGVTPRVEALFIPAIIADAAFGLSYTYYAGTASPMNFQARYIDFTDGEVEDEADWDTYSASYTLVNINKWDASGAPQPAIAQTFKKVAGAFVDISDPIVVPATGSRMPTYTLPKGLKKTKISAVSRLKKL